MKWQEGLLAACAVSTAILGWVTLRRGRKTDEALNMSANIQNTYETQNDIIEGLRGDVFRLHAAHQACEEATNSLRRALAESDLVADARAREIARLKSTVGEHEQTISRHEATINQLRAGTPADRRERER